MERTEYNTVENLKKIIEWLIGVESLAGETYEKAREHFKNGDEELSALAGPQPFRRSIGYADNLGRGRERRCRGLVRRVRRNDKARHYNRAGTRGMHRQD
jgi:hypothetical protein